MNAHTMIEAHVPHAGTGDHVPVALGAVRSFLGCLGEGRVFTYVSMPLTTGRHFTEWFRVRGADLWASDRASYDALHRSEVIARNAEHGHGWVRRLRERRRDLGETRPVMEPSRFTLDGLDQPGYLSLWIDFIARLAAEAIFLDGWQYSSGCAAEYVAAFEAGVPALDEGGRSLGPSRAARLMADALTELDDLRCVSTTGLRGAVERLRDLSGPTAPGRPTLSFASTEGLVKDQVLDDLARSHNVAQFVSFGSDLRQRFSRVLGEEPNRVFAGLDQAVGTLLARSPEASVNVRSFTPGQPRSNEFVYGLRSVDAVRANVERLAAQGLVTIVNETIDKSDGGVSGVAQHDFMEFVPDDTPRGVEKGGSARLSLDLGTAVLRTVYGFVPDLGDVHGRRVEFSVHPVRRGWRKEHTVIWEAEEVEAAPSDFGPSWPNRFSALVGDKAFGLLVAHLGGLPVPRTTVIGRRVAPFTFGLSTGTREPWLRTVPKVVQPGRFTTTHGWTDPFRLLGQEDPGAEFMASVLHQEGVEPAFSGGAAELADGSALIEGVPGIGLGFMSGDRPDGLPEAVMRDVRALHARVRDLVGAAVELEWVHDGSRAWLVQLHAGRQVEGDEWIFRGDAIRWVDFDPRAGLPALRELIAGTQDDTGVVLTEDVGRSSHVSQLLRLHRRASRVGVRARD